MDFSSLYPAVDADINDNFLHIDPLDTTSISTFLDSPHFTGLTTQLPTTIDPDLLNIPISTMPGLTPDTSATQSTTSHSSASSSPHAALASPPHTSSLLALALSQTASASSSQPSLSGSASEGSSHKGRHLNRGDQLKRNAACIPCRRRRTKCDATRPHCAACVRHHNYLKKTQSDVLADVSEIGCYYDDDPGASDRSLRGVGAGEKGKSRRASGSGRRGSKASKSSSDSGNEGMGRKSSGASSRRGSRLSMSGASTPSTQLSHLGMTKRNESASDFSPPTFGSGPDLAQISRPATSPPQAVYPAQTQAMQPDLDLSMLDLGVFGSPALLGTNFSDPSSSYTDSPMHAPAEFPSPPRSMAQYTLPQSMPFSGVPAHVAQAEAVSRAMSWPPSGASAFATNYTGQTFAFQDPSPQSRAISGAPEDVSGPMPAQDAASAGGARPSTAPSAALGLGSTWNPGGLFGLAGTAALSLGAGHAGRAGSGSTRSSISTVLADTHRRASLAVPPSQVAPATYPGLVPVPLPLGPPAAAKASQHPTPSPPQAPLQQIPMLPQYPPFSASPQPQLQAQAQQPPVGAVPPENATLGLGLFPSTMDTMPSMSQVSEMMQTLHGSPAQSLDSLPRAASVGHGMSSIGAYETLAMAQPEQPGHFQIATGTVTASAAYPPNLEYGLGTAPSGLGLGLEEPWLDSGAAGMSHAEIPRSAAAVPLRSAPGPEQTDLDQQQLATPEQLYALLQRMADDGGV